MRVKKKYKEYRKKKRQCLWMCQAIRYAYEVVFFVHGADVACFEWCGIDVTVIKIQGC